MKKNLYAFILLFIITIGCTKKETSDEKNPDGKTIAITALMPDAVEKRVGLAQESGTKNIVVKWKSGDQINLFFKQGNIIKEQLNVPIGNISDNGKTAQFTISLPQGIIASQTFDLYGTHAVSSGISGGNILADVRPSATRPIAEIQTPLMFKKINITNVSNLNVTFTHMGALHIINLKNTSANNWTISGIEPLPNVSSVSKWYYTQGSNGVPKYNIITGQIEYSAGNPLSNASFNIPGGETVQLAQWVMPNGNNVPEIKLSAYSGSATVSTAETKPARANTTETGKAYHIAAVWNGSQLKFASALKFRSGIFLHHSTGADIWHKDGASTDVPAQMTLYNTTNNYTGANAVSMRENWWGPGDNEWFTQYKFFTGTLGDENINNYLTNRIIVIKSCFPSSNMTGRGDATDYASNPDNKTLYNYKKHWMAIVNIMKQHPDNFFVIWTNAPRKESETDLQEAALAKEFCTWAKQTLATGNEPEFGAFPPNVYVFDFFSKLTDANGFMLSQYCTWDSHPNADASVLVAPQFVKEIFDAAITYENSMIP